MTASQDANVILFNAGGRQSAAQALVREEPLSIRVEGKPYVVVMRTPGDEIPHAAGFCLAEGLVDAPEDIATIGFCAEAETNVATLTLTPERRQKVEGLLARQGFVSQTSCGICGKQLVRDLHQITRPVKVRFRISVSQALACADRLSDFQPLHQITRGAHGAVIFDENQKILAWAEDVGRHNALDKAIGKVFMAGALSRAGLGVMSSRLSYELVQKAARAGLEMLIGVSRPTALGVDLARSVGMSLACARGEDLMIFCGEDRFYPEAGKKGI